MLRCLLVTFIAVIVTQCSRETPAPRSIRAHTVDHGGVMHAFPESEALRYCSGCHGKNLVGGLGLEPSCYSCHGARWRDADGSRAPADHDTAKILDFTTYSQVRGKAYGISYNHHPLLKTPDDNCTSCHGTDLTGNREGLTIPSCLLCHEKRW